MTILVVTHDLGLAWNIADRIAVMYLGRIVEQGPTEEVLANPQHPYTRALLSVVPETRRWSSRSSAARHPTRRAIPAGCRFHPRCPLVASGEAARLGDRGALSTGRISALEPAVRRAHGEHRGGVLTPLSATTRLLQAARDRPLEAPLDVADRRPVHRPRGDDLDDDVVPGSTWSGAAGAPRSRRSPPASRSVARPRARPRTAGVAVSQTPTSPS